MFNFHRIIKNCNNYIICITYDFFNQKNGAKKKVGSDVRILSQIGVGCQDFKSGLSWIFGV